MRVSFWWSHLLSRTSVSLPSRSHSHIITTNIRLWRQYQTMLQFIKKCINLLLTWLTAFIQLLKSPFQPQPCKQCPCEDYTDEELFTWMKERSTQPSYPADMLAERIIDKPLNCSHCNCPRERHGNLKPKILTCDMMPNGGLVYIEKLERERIQRRHQRFRAATTEQQPRIQIIQLKEGTGRIVKQGDEVQCHYDAFITSTMEKFETSRDADPIRFTLGNADVVPGLEQGVLGCTVGSRRRIIVPAPLAYGPKRILGQRYVDVTFDAEVSHHLTNCAKSFLLSMYQGHHGAALLISGITGHPIPLPMLFLLSQLQDIIFVYLAYVQGIEIVALQNPRTNAVNPFELIYIPYSHGLISTTLYTAIAAMAFRGNSARFAAAASVASHWLLDFIVHLPDMDICLPFANCPKVGLGLWYYLWPSIIVESAVVIVGTAVYVRTIKEVSTRREVSWRLVPFAAFMVFVTAMLPFVPPPPKLDSSITVQVYCSYLLVVVITWAIERPLYREVKRD